MLAALPRATIPIRMGYTYDTRALRHSAAKDATASQQDAIQSSGSWPPGRDTMRLTLAALAATLALAAPTDAGPPLYRSPDGNTVTIQLFNRGAATWAAGRGGSSGARTAYTTAVSLNEGFPVDLLVDTGAMGFCIIQQEIDWMLSGVNHFGRPSLLPSDFRGRTVIETASGQRLIRDKWNIREVYAFGFVLHNVEAVSCGKNGSLLGQGVLARFKSWSIDNEKGTITVVGPPINGEAVR
jgi:hypothetical protein